MSHSNVSSVWNLDSQYSFSKYDGIASESFGAGFGLLVSGFPRLKSLENHSLPKLEKEEPAEKFGLPAIEVDFHPSEISNECVEQQSSNRVKTRQIQHSDASLTDNIPLLDFSA
jgi:hypothetical protein